MKIFLSYASEDKPVVEPIYYSLVENHNVFFDRKSLPPGDNFDTRIRKAVKASDLFIYCISPQSVATGSYTHSELKFAEKKWTHPNKNILPVMVRETSYDEIPNYVKAVTVLETSGNMAAEVAERVRVIGRTRRRRKLIKVIGILLVVALAGFIGRNIFLRPDPNRNIDTPRISLFEVRPPVVKQGEPSVLIWRTTKADHVELLGIGKVSPQGRRQITPTATTAYRLIARNKTGREVSKEVSVKVENDVTPEETQDADTGNDVTDKPVTAKTITLKGGTGFIFSTAKTTQGQGVDRDIWWNSLEFIPSKRMYSLGKISDVTDIRQVATGHFDSGVFVPRVQEGYAVEIRREQKISYAIVQVVKIDKTRSVTIKWLYPFTGQVTGSK